MTPSPRANTSAKSYVLRGITGTLAVKVLGTGLGLLLSVLLARTMGPTQYGLYAFATETMFFLALPIGVGLPTLLTREVATYGAAGDYSSLAGILRWSVAVAAGIGLVVIAGSFAAVRIFFHGSAKTSAFLTALPLAFLYALSQLRSGALRGLKQPVRSRVPDAVIRPAVSVSVVLIANQWFDVAIDASFAIYALCGALATGLVVGALWLRSALPREALLSRDANYEFRRWITEGVPFLLLGGIGIINTRLGMTVSGIIMPAEDVASLKIAVTASTLMAFVLTSVTTTIGPLIAEYTSAGRRRELQSLLTKTARAAFAVSGLIGLVFVLFGRQLIQFVYGVDYVDAYVPLVILTVGQLSNAAAGAVGSLLNMTGHQRVAVKGQVLSAIVAVVLTATLTPFFGITGAATATSVSYVVWNTVLLYSAKQKTGLTTWAFRMKRE